MITCAYGMTQEMKAETAKLSASYEDKIRELESQKDSAVEELEAKHKDQVKQITESLRVRNTTTSQS